MDPFVLFQKQLVSFANTKLGRQYLSFGRPQENRRAVYVGPNGIHFLNPNGTITARLRTNDIVDKKLKAALNLGLEAATVLASLKNPGFLAAILATKSLDTHATGEGYYISSSTATGGDQASWDEAHDRSSANFFSSNSDGVIQIGSQYTDRYYISRGVVPVSLATIPRGSKVRGTPILQVWFYTKSNDDNDGNDYVVLVGPTTQNDPTTIAGSDYSKIGAINNPQALAATIDYGSITLDQMTDFSLNATAITHLQSNFGQGGYFLGGLREGHDATDNKFDNNFNTGNVLQARGNNYATAAQHVELDITYNPPSGAFLIL